MMLQERFRHFFQKARRNPQVDTTPGVEESTTPSETQPPLIEIEGVVTEQNVPWLAATIVVDGKQTTSWFLFDTGASVTVISPQVARKLGINFDPSNTILITGLFKDKFQMPCNIVTAELYFKGKSNSPKSPIFAKTPVELYVPRPGSISITDSYGLLGRDVLNKFDYEIDFAQKRLRLDVRDEPNDAVLVVASIPTFKQD